jgi:uncharacterized membrane protein
VPDDPLEEIRLLRETVTRVEKRLETLERLVASRPPVPTPAVRAAPSPPSPPAAPSTALPPAPRENLELKIGRYWLNRIGILSLVLGTAFFLVYSFQYLGPVAKLAMGYAVGAGLLFLGLRLERRTGIEWYGRGLMGGGWAVVYFTTYAMYHVPETKILSSAPLDLALLLAVAAGAIRHALTYRSPAITMLAFLLGFLTTGISEVTSFTFLSSVILIGSLVVIAARMRWHSLLLYGMAGSYVTHLAAVERHVTVAGPAAAFFWLHASFLTLYGLGYSIGVLAFDEREKPRRDALVTTTVANGLAFALLLLPRVGAAYPGSSWVALAVMGAVGLILGAVAALRGLPSVSTAHVLLGLSFLTIAVPQKLTRRWTGFFWLGEVASLAWLGVLLDRWAYRIFALALAYLAFVWLVGTEAWDLERITVLGRSMSWRWMIGGFGISCYMVAALASRRLSPGRYRWSLEGQSFHLYSAAACLVLWILTAITGPQADVPRYWALEAGAVTVIGWVLKDRGIRAFGAVWFAAPFVLVLGFLAGDSKLWDLRTALVLTASLYAMGILYRREPPGPRLMAERHFSGAFVVAASTVLTAVLWHDIQRHWLSLAWALEGLALVVIGFRLPDKPYRMSGLGVFCVLLLKVLFVDLAAAQTIYRILSFAVAGAILLLASFGYAKFTAKEPRPADPVEPPAP